MGCKASEGLFRTTLLRFPNPKNEDPSHQTVIRLSPFNTTGNDPKRGGHRMLVVRSGPNWTVDLARPCQRRGIARDGNHSGRDNSGRVAGPLRPAARPPAAYPREGPSTDGVPAAPAAGSVLCPGGFSLSCETPVPPYSAQPETRKRDSRPPAFRAPRLSSPRPWRRGREPVWLRSRPHFSRDAFSVPDPSAPGAVFLPCPPLLTPGATARSRRRRPTRAGIESEIEARKTKHARPPDEKKTGG